MKRLQLEMQKLLLEKQKQQVSSKAYTVDKKASNGYTKVKRPNRMLQK